MALQRVWLEIVSYMLPVSLKKSIQLNIILVIVTVLNFQIGGGARAPVLRYWFYGGAGAEYLTRTPKNNVLWLN